MFHLDSEILTLWVYLFFRDFIISMIYRDGIAQNYTPVDIVQDVDLRIIVANALVVEAGSFDFM